MNDDRLDAVLGSFYRDTALAPPDPEQGLSEVMARVRQTRQRGRWLPFPQFRRKAQTATATDTTDYRPSPIPATNGHAPTVIGRTHAMFSPVKAITAGALVFALGGVLLIAQPFDRQGSVPGAEQPAVTPAVSSFTGTITDARYISSPTETMRADGLTQTTGFVSSSRWEASDPRMTGDVTYTGNYLYDDSVDIHSATYELTNDEGSWLGEATGLWSEDFDVSFWDTVIFTGRDAYEGLTAYVFVDWNAEPPEPFMGVIFPGAMPEVPEPYVAE